MRRMIGERDVFVDRSQTSSNVISSLDSIDLFEDTEQKVTLDKRSYLKEAAALEKLIAPSEFHEKVDDIEEKREFPDNNPLKKRKVVDFQLEQMQTTTEQASKVIDVEE
ncbi:uncharacterized protein LOC122085977 isoform X1 [Macadamia integrifolia]|uniref:uncharacterized protein LOC122085977 isoform X1 n=1 Tax=Macadamia integrifolia TaxID=60698 RepID=UPI001C4EB9DC|nr:uncharacterized protein LOC122085977 isoform X1 [Macadamia integrifolia]